MKCRKCGSGNMGVMPNKKNPSATDLYCLDCGAWQKFATKDEIRLYQCKKGPITNADRIRAMSDEELAEFLENVHNSPCETCCDNLYWCRRNNAPEPACKNHFADWLRQPVEEG